MKNLTILILMVAALLAFSACGDSGNQSNKNDRDTAKTEISKVPVCPVCHMRLENVSKDTPQTVYKGKTFYFMNNEMKQQFIKNPDEYINPDLSIKD